MLGISGESVDKSEAEYESLRNTLKNREAKHRSEQLKSAVVVLVVGVAGLVASVSQINDLFGVKAKKSDTAFMEVIGVRSHLETLDSRLTRVDDLVKALTKPDPAASISVEQQKLSFQMNSLDERLKKIESVILESPERALSIPLLRKDIGEAVKRAEEYRAASRSDIDRLYEQQKWMLGGIGTVLLAVIGGAITIIFRSLPKVKVDEA